MKTNGSRKKRRCKNFAWRDDNTTWITDRANDKIVFRKIHALVKRHGIHPRKAVELLAHSEKWAWRLTGKTANSWKRKYNLWRQELAQSGTLFKRKNLHFVQ